MVSTTVNEDQMLKLLGIEATGANAKELLTGTALLLLDTFDRRLPRPQAETYITAAMKMYDIVGRLSAFDNALTHLKETGAITPADLMLAIDGCEALVKSQAAECVKLATLLTKCAGNEVTVQ